MVKFWKRLRFVFHIRKFVPFLFEFFTTKRVPVKQKILSVLLIVGYALFPIDVIPDFLAFFGILDDVTILMFVLQQIVKMSPPELKEKHGVGK
jgi:uncharacterized membrane protein YkvA (DUF1232 family)